MKKVDGLLHKGKVYWTPVCVVCGEKMELNFRKCDGCKSFFAFEFVCKNAHKLQLTDTCPNCGYAHYMGILI